MNYCEDNNDGYTYYGSFGESIASMLGVPKDSMPGTRYDNRMKALNELQIKYKTQMQTNIIDYCRLDSSSKSFCISNMNLTNQALQETVKYNDLIIKNNIELDQIEIVGIYALFLVIYLYLMLL
jgi:hypothetical protein